MMPFIYVPMFCQQVELVYPKMKILSWGRTDLDSSTPSEVWMKPQLPRAFVALGGEVERKESILRWLLN